MDNVAVPLAEHIFLSSSKIERRTVLELDIKKWGFVKNKTLERASQLFLEFRGGESVTFFRNKKYIQKSVKTSALLFYRVMNSFEK
ncbi:hypothetical protein DJ013_08245 [Arcticibacterium luteifluviistationis]|uniref:Uncharacterized protein n=1 Tax=Arcticibacterium luteifluviistationis TaxID=1784714 RepID=A0A2Z4GB50_9BACT|nr:hypothetical protein DJ013_08245 [Arcticibacterium luteifluviistationis]